MKQALLESIEPIIIGMLVGLAIGVLLLSRWHTCNTHVRIVHTLPETVIEAHL